MARAVYATNVPLGIYENPYWVKALMLMRPKYDPPSRYRVSNGLLNTEYQKTQQTVMEKINNASVLTLITDGWTDCNGVSLMNIILCTPEPVFYKAIDTKDNPHTGDYIAEVLADAIYRSW